MSSLKMKSEFARKKVICYAGDHNTAVIKQLCIQHVAEHLYKGKDEKDSCNQPFCRLYAYYDSFGIGMWLGSISHPEERSLEYLKSHAQSAAVLSPEAFIQELDECVAAGKRISNAEIALSKFIAPEKTEVYFAARQHYIDERDKRDAEKRAEREAEDAAYCEQYNAVARAKTEAAIRCIQVGGELRNEPITFFSSRYSYKTPCLINYLARKYGVEFPLKVQGWVAKSLGSIFIEDGHVIKYRYAGGRSETIPRYGDMLIEAILKAHPVESTT